MKDIVKAIEAEKEYIQLNLQGEQPNIHDFLDTWGYSNLEEFHNDKVEYSLKHLDWEITSHPNIDIEFTEKYINNRLPGFMYSIGVENNPYAFVRNNYEHIAELENLGYTVIRFGYNTNNGLILSYDGDLRIYMVLPEEIDANAFIFLDKMKNYFVELGLNATIDNNDIMVDGKKVCGSGGFFMNKMRIIVFQVTFSDHVEEIKGICGETPKEPGFIPQNILTAEQLKDKFLEWLQ